MTPAMRIIKKSITHCACIGPFIIWTLIYAPFLRFSFLYEDTVIYTVCAKILLHGGVPYLDFWDNKPPLVFFLYALILKLFGSDNYPAINYVTLCFIFCSTALIYIIAKQLFDRMTALFAMLLYPVISNLIICRDAINPNTEIYMQTFVLLGLMLSIRAILRKQHHACLLGAGVCFGIASAFKQPAVLAMTPVFALLCMQYLQDKKLILMIRGALWFIAGFAGVWAGLIGYLYVNNALESFLFLSFHFNFFFSRHILERAFLAKLFVLLVDIARTYPPVAALYATGIGYALYRIVSKRTELRERIALVFVLIWHIVDTAAILRVGHFCAHYFVQWLPAMTILVSLPFRMLKKKISTRSIMIGFTAIYVYLCAVLVHLFTSYYTSKQNYTDALFYLNPYGMKIINLAKKHFGAGYYRYPLYYKFYEFPTLAELMEKIRLYSQENDTIFIWSEFPAPYLMASRLPASRFIYNRFLTGHFNNTPNLYAVPHSLLAGHEPPVSELLLNDLQANKPALIILDNFHEYAQTQFIRSYLNKQYKKVDEFRGFELYIPKEL